MKLQRQALTSASLSDANRDALRQIFPSAFSEVQTADGKLSHKIDFDALRELLTGEILDPEEEHFAFTWVGKQEAKRAAAEPTRQTLRPVPAESVDWDSTENLYIEGDNLEVLKLLQRAYLGRVKMIYIDPPYNTGNDFVYEDDFAQSREDYDLASGDVDDEGNRLRKNTDSDPRYHSAWCSMIYSRLFVARTLLANDGVIFISIDDNEVHHLRKICDEIFGARNFVAEISVYSNPRGRQSDEHIARAHEYVLLYGKSDSLQLRGEDLTDEQKDEYCKKDDRGTYRELGLRLRGGRATAVESPTLHFPIYYILESKQISLDPQPGAVEMIPRFKDGTLGTWRWSREKIIASKEELVVRLVKGGDGERYDIFQKDYLTEDKKRKAKSLWIDKDINYGSSEILCDDLIVEREKS